MIENENFRCFPCQDMLIRCFRYGVFEIFVSSLFLLVVFAFGEHWYSALYNSEADSQEKYHDLYLWIAMSHKKRWIAKSLSRFYINNNFFIQLLFILFYFKITISSENNASIYWIVSLWLAFSHMVA